MSVVFSPARQRSEVDLVFLRALAGRVVIVFELDPVSMDVTLFKGNSVAVKWAFLLVTVTDRKRCNQRKNCDFADLCNFISCVEPPEEHSGPFSPGKFAPP